MIPPPHHAWLNIPTPHICQPSGVYFSVIVVQWSGCGLGICSSYEDEADIIHYLYRMCLQIDNTPS